MKLIDLSKARENLQYEKIEKKINSYALTLSKAVDNVEEILDDMEESGINWHQATEEQRDKMEAISMIGLCMDTYASWIRE